MSGSPYGTLGKTELIVLLRQLLAKNQELSQFGWNQRGAGGTYSLLTNWIQYQAHREGASGILTFPFDASIVYGNDMPAGCAQEDVFRYVQQNINQPFWFFDWCKQYLAFLRVYQPAFDAPVEAKLVWTLNVAWVVNAALGSTNLHGSILPSAIYEHVTGNSFDEWAGDGSYMYTAQYAAALPDYWKEAWTHAAKETISKTSGSVLLDSGYKVFDRKFEVKWESQWHGSLFPAPLETRRFRYDPPLQIGIDCDKISGRCKDATRGVAGAYYNDTIVNDPYVVRSSNGQYADDKGLTHVRYQFWSRFVPWLQVALFGDFDSARATQLDPDGGALLAPTLIMATLFSQGLGLGTGDMSFWARLEEWKRPEHATPALLRTGTSAKGSVPLFSANHELSFRYYYPAMVDLVLACDYYSLISTGINTWWKYNIGSGVGGVGTWRATEDTPFLNANGQRLRDKNGIPYAAPIAPAGSPQEAYDVYREQKEKSSGLKFGLNWAQSLIAIFQAVAGNYGALVSAGKSWYDAYSTKFPEPEDSWRGVVPPSPLVQRRVPAFGFVGSHERGVQAQRAVVPDVGANTNTVPAPQGYGGIDTIAMMADVRAYTALFERFGAPFTKTPEDRIDLEGFRNPVLSVKPEAARSIVFPDFPVPGFQPGSEAALAATRAANTPVTPAKRSRAGLLILSFGFAAAVGGVLVAKGVNFKFGNSLNKLRWRHG